MVTAMRDAGVGILAGSDAGMPFIFPGFSLHEELELLVATGLTPAEALRAATLSAAEYLEAADSLGTIAPGILADLVLLDANPLDDIRNTQRIRAVIFGGRYSDRQALDKVLAGVEAAAGENDTVHVAPPTGVRETDRASIIAALKQVTPGGTVQFAPGSYQVGGFIPVTVPGITLLGHSEGTMLRGCEPGEAVDYEHAMNRCAGLELNGGHQTVRNLTFQSMSWAALRIAGPRSASQQSAVPISEGGHLIEGNTFRDSDSFDVISDAPEPIVIRNNTFINTYHAVAIQGRNVHFVDNRVTAPVHDRIPYGRADIAIGVAQFSESAPHCADNVIAGNRIEGHSDGIVLGVFSPGTSCRGNTVRDNTIVVRPITLTAMESSVIGGDVDTPMVGIPLRLLNYPQWCLTGLPTDAWVCRPDETGRGAVLADNLIEGNRIIGAAGVAIEMLHASNNRIVNNTISDVARWDRSPEGVLRHAPGWREANGAGIWISAGSDENEIVRNTFADIAGDAVVIEGDRNRVELRGAADAVRDLGSANRVSPAGGLSPAALRAVADTIEAWAGRGEIVGAEVLIMKDGLVAFHEAREWSDREMAIPLARNSVYRIRSMTKPVVGTAVLMLVDDGLLSLEDRASKYLPSFDTDRSRGITIRQLLTHTAGFERWGSVGSEADAARFESLRALVDAYGEAGPQHPSGTRYLYSNVGSAVLSAVVAEVAGVPAERFIENRILRPLGMGDTYTSFATTALWASRMNPTYAWNRRTREFDRVWDAGREMEFRFFRGSAGLHSTAADYARFMGLWLNRGSAGSGRLLSEQSVREALRTQAGREYGLHWQVPESRVIDGLPALFGHGGVDGTWAVAYPAQNAIVLYFTQSGQHDRADAFFHLIGDIGLFDHPGPDWLHMILPDEEQRPVLSAEDMDRYVGVYQGQDAGGVPFTLTITTAAGGGFLVAAFRSVDGSVAWSDDLVPLAHQEFAPGRYRDGTAVGMIPGIVLSFRAVDGVLGEAEVRDGEQTVFSFRRRPEQTGTAQ
jgi:CubicO group peptidase (beta-lactamase class C family)